MDRGQRIALIGAALVVVAIALLVLSGGDDDEDSTPRTVSEQTLSPAVETIRVTGGKPHGGVKEITLNKDDTVRLEVRSDTAAEVHIHGYDLMEDVEAGGSVAFRFKADIEGVFEIELEETKTPIAELTVEP